MQFYWHQIMNMFCSTIFGTASTAIKFPVYVAVMTMLKNHQNPINIRSAWFFGRHFDPKRTRVKFVNIY